MYNVIMEKKPTYISVLISLPVAVSADVDLALFDPMRGRIKYGARSRLVSALLTSWLAKLKKKGKSNGESASNN